MSHPLHHSISSVKKFGGTIDDYLPIQICLNVPGGDNWNLGSTTINGTNVVPAGGYTTNWRTKFLFWGMETNAVMPVNI